MKKQKHHLPSDQIHIPEEIEESHYVNWISKHGKTVLLSITGLFVVLVLFFWVSSGENIKSESNYILAERDFIAFQSGKNGEKFAELRKIIASHPELEAKYDGVIAQTLLNKDQVEEAMPPAKRTIARTQSDDLTFYSDYAQTTLLISNQQYETALAETVTLKEKMLENAASENKAFGDTLFAFNLLRIAILQQTLNDKEGELEAWEEFRLFARWSNKPAPSDHIDPKIFQIVLNIFEENQVPLIDYIEARESFLKS